ncbi:hypothetical protein V866_004177 [Kwoniella sp. B9012]
MTFPSSVEHLPLPRSKQRGRVSRRNDDYDEEEGHRSTPRETEVRTESGVGGTILDFGRHGGVGLERTKKGWEWVWASEERNDLRYVNGEKAICLFPATRSVEREVNISGKDMIDSSTKYIESLCSPYERYGLREALTSILDEDTTHQAGPSNTSKQRGLGIPERDVYEGPKLALIDNPRARIAKTLLAFPVGEVGHCLNISPFLPANSTKVDQRSRLHFLPTHKTVERFPTPILQIISSPVVSSSRIDREATALLVRLQSTTHLLNLIPDHTYVPPSSEAPVICQRTALLSYEDTEGRRHVDVALDPKIWSRILVVDDFGGVWLWWEEKDNKNGRIEKAWNLRKIRDKVTDEKNQFFRIAFGTKSDTALVISARDCVVIDLNDPGHPYNILLTLHGKDRQFTSLDKTALERGSQHTVIATNHEIMWVDERKPGTPIISWKHDFGTSTDLQVGVIPGLSNRDLCTILYSTAQRFLLAFPIAKSSHPRSLSHPYPLNIPINGLGSILPFTPASFRHSRCLIGITSDGAIYSVPLLSANGRSRPARTDLKKPITEIKSIWDEHVRSLKDKVGGDQKREDAERIKSGKELDLRWAWLEINQSSGMVDQKTYFHPVEFEQYLRELDAPFEHFMTAGDLARDCIYPEPTELQSHLLSPLPIHPQGSKVTIDSLTQMNLSKNLPVISRFGNDLPIHDNCRPQFRTIANKDTSTDLDISPSNTYEILRESFPMSKKNDVAQLALDLSLSTTIFSSEPIVMPFDDAHHNTQMTEPDDLFTRAAGLSLSEKEPPKITYHHLIPQLNHIDDDEVGMVIGKEKENEDELQDLTARGLLNDWKLSSNPLEYTWKSWRRDDEFDDHTISHREPVRSQTQTQAQTQTQIQVKMSLSQTQNERMIKPLPSHSQSQFRYSQPTLSTFARPQQHSQFSYRTPPSLSTIEPQSLIQSNRSRGLTPTFSLPNLRHYPPDLGLSRSSPPPQPHGPVSSQPPTEEVQWAATQVERGPFGGRGDKEKKKKKEKKRIGGF